MQPSHASVEFNPSNVAIGAGMARGAAGSDSNRRCNTGSTKFEGTVRPGRIFRNPSSFSIVRGAEARPVGKSRTAGETLLSRDLLTTGLKELAVPERVGAGVGAAMSASITPPKNRMKATKARGVRNPDSELFFSMTVLLLVGNGRPDGTRRAFREIDRQQTHEAMLIGSKAECFRMVFS